MKSRRRAALVVLALASTAFAGFTEFDFPSELRAGQRKLLLTGTPRALAAVKSSAGRPSAARTAPTPRMFFSAPVLHARAIDTQGAITDLALPVPTDLADPIPVPAGTVDLELTLGGPLQLQWVGDGAPQVRSLDLPTLLVALDEPDALDALDQVVVDLDLAAALDARTDAEAAALLQDSATAIPW